MHIQTDFRASRRVVVVGAGPAGLMAAERAAAAGAQVSVYDRMPSPGRKLLMAGRGGLNLTHGEPLEPFLGRYQPEAPALRAAVGAFAPADLRNWSEALGEPTVVGSSGRVFPRSFKALPLLRAWLGRLARAGVVLHLRHAWTGWSDAGALCFATPSGNVAVEADATVLALGGASWPRLGSDGRWTAVLAAHGVATAPLRPSNCGFLVDWPEPFAARYAGEPLKGIALSFDGRTARGEAVVTASGLEGGALYALSGPIRDAIARGGDATMQLALRPELNQEAIATRLAAQPRKASLSTVLRKALKLSPVAIALVQMARHQPSGATTPLPQLINALRVRLIAPASLDRAISSAGGVRWEEVDASFMLQRRPGVFVAGEMLDWEAPTGGYLLQACFATGAAAGSAAAAYALTVGPGEPACGPA